jgi:hypothetical protein
MGEDRIRDSGPTTVPARGAGERAPFVPLLLLAIAVAGWSAFQCYQLTFEQQTLVALRAAQQRQVEEAGRLRVALDGIARETALLADAGNANAKLIVDELKKRGVRIDPAAPPLAPPGGATR